MTTDYRSIMLALIRGDSWRSITDTYGCSRTTIDKAARALRDHRLTADTVHRLTATDLAELFPDTRRRGDQEFLLPDFASIAARRQRSGRVTLAVEHARYQQQPLATGQQHYSYKQFCKLFSRYVDVNELTTQLTHLAGDEMEVDWSGDTTVVTDPLTGQTTKAYVFVAALPHSGMMFAAAYPDMKMRSWLSAHQDALHYFGGVPKRVVPDNTHTATNQLLKGVRAREINEQYRQ